MSAFELPTFEEISEIEAADRTALQAFIWENPCANAKQDAFFRQQLTDLIFEVRKPLVDALYALERCPGVDTTDQVEGVTFRGIIRDALKA